jgi:hypothetical protein
MSTKSMFFRIIASEIIFFGLCIFLFLANLAFWLNDIGLAERFLKISVTPPIPLVSLGLIYILAIIIYAILMSKLVKRLKISSSKNCKRAFLLSIGLHIFAFSSSTFILFALDSNSMKTVIPSIISLYFAAFTLFLLIMYVSLFFRTNKNNIMV